MASRSSPSSASQPISARNFQAQASA